MIDALLLIVILGVRLLTVVKLGEIIIYQIGKDPRRWRERLYVWGPWLLALIMYLYGAGWASINPQLNPTHLPRVTLSLAVALIAHLAFRDMRKRDLEQIEIQRRRSILCPLERICPLGEEL